MNTRVSGAGADLKSVLNTHCLLLKGSELLRLHSLRLLLNLKLTYCRVLWKRSYGTRKWNTWVNG